MNTEYAKIGRRLWLWWILASTVVLAVGVTVGGVVIIFGAVVSNLLGAVGGVAVVGAVVGSSLGIVQWLLLRRQVSRSGWWILASAAGGAVGFALAVAVLIILDLVGSDWFSISVDPDDLGAIGLVIVIAIVASYGIPQSLVLRRRVPRSGSWILASAAGPAVIYLVLFDLTLFVLDRLEVFPPEYSYRSGTGVNVAVFVGVVGAVLGYGVITGRVLVWLLRPPEEAELRAPNILPEKLWSKLRSNRTWLLAGAVILIVLVAGYFLFATIKVNNIIAGLQVPPCSEAKYHTIVTCYIKRAYCRRSGARIARQTICYDDRQLSSRGFILIATEYEWQDLDGQCLLVTGVVTTERTYPSMSVYDQSGVEICQLMPSPTALPPAAFSQILTGTSEPWDARVSALAGNLREFPHLNSQIMHTLIGDAKVDLLAVSPDNKWVHVKTAAVEGNPILEGWLQVDKLVLNVSLDDLTVDAETVFVQPPTRTPGPTGTP